MRKGSVDCIQAADYVLMVYLPPSYDGYRAFPVLYMQDGGNLFLDNVVPIESLFAAGTLEETMLIIHKRMDHNYIHFIKRFPGAIQWLFSACQ